MGVMWVGCAVPQIPQLHQTAAAPHYLLSHFQGTNGSQLWDTAFAVQAFLEVTHPSVLHTALGKWALLPPRTPAAPAGHPLRLQCQLWHCIMTEPGKHTSS